MKIVNKLQSAHLRFKNLCEPPSKLPPWRTLEHLEEPWDPFEDPMGERGSQKGGREWVPKGWEILYYVNAPKKLKRKIKKIYKNKLCPEVVMKAHTYQLINKFKKTLELLSFLTKNFQCDTFQSSFTDAIVSFTNVPEEIKV